MKWFASFKKLLQKADQIAENATKNLENQKSGIGSEYKSRRFTNFSSISLVEI
jgi:hypothetical protein